MTLSRTDLNNALSAAIDAEGGLEKLARDDNPKAALERLHARFQLISLAGSYTGADPNSKAFRNLLVTEGSANADTVSDLPTLRARTRALTRNNPIASGVLENKLSHVIGPGLRFQSQLDADFLRLSESAASRLKARIEREWSLWSQSTHCDLEGTSTFNELQALAFRGSWIDGDILALFPFVERVGHPYGLKVQLIEAERIGQPLGQRDEEDNAGGIIRDKQGYVIGYRIASHHPGGLDYTTPQYETVDATADNGQLRALHLFHKQRPGQSRGVPELAPVMETIQQLGTYTESEVQGAIVSALFAVAITSGTPPSFTGDNVAFGLPAAPRNNDIRMGSGSLINLQPGEDIKSIASNRPNTGFDGFVKAVLVQVGMSLNLPYEVLIQHFSSSYSASRAALLVAWRHYRNRRHWIASRFCQPIFELWLREAVARGRVAAPGYLSGDPLIRAAYARGRWVGPAPGQINAKEESEASLLKINGNLSTYEAEVAEASGLDYYDVLAQRGRERREIADLNLPEYQLPGQGPAANNTPAADSSDNSKE